MRVIFYRHKKRRNSTLRPSGGASFDCVLKDSSSVINPTIIIKWDGQSGAPLYNQAYIPAYERYYWIENWTYTDRCWVASMAVDVLASFKEDIGNSEKYVLRAASDQNNNVVDMKYPAVFPLTVQQFPIPLNWAETFAQGDYIVSVVGNNGGFSAAGSCFYQLVAANLDRLINSVFTETEDLWDRGLAGGDLNDTLKDYGLKFFKSIANPAQFINSIYWVPFKVNPGTGPQLLKLGDLTSGAAGLPLTTPIVIKTFEQVLPGMPHDEPAELDVNPLVSYRLYMPPFGNFEIDARIIRQYGGVDGRIIIDVTNGESVLEVYGHGQTGAPIFMAQGSIGTPIALSGTSVDYAGLAKSSWMTGASVTRSLMGLDIVGAVSGAAAGVIDAAQAGAPTASNGGYGGGLAALRSFCGLVATAMERADPDWEEQGHPVMERRVINGFSGYVLCADGDIVSQATENELKEIEAFLTGGFFYE